MEFEEQQIFVLPLLCKILFNSAAMSHRTVLNTTRKELIGKETLYCKVL